MAVRESVSERERASEGERERASERERVKDLEAASPAPARARPPLGLGDLLRVHQVEPLLVHLLQMCCVTEAGSYLRLIDSCITQLKAQGPSRTCTVKE